MTFAAPLKSMDFPPREDFRRVLLVPLFIEPMDFSGERICAGIVARCGAETARTSADHVLRYRCVYGSAVETLGMVADLALQSLQSYIAKVEDNVDELQGWTPPSSGISLGRAHVTTARSLDEALVHALAEHAAAVAIGGQQPDRGIVGDRYASMSSVRLEREVRELAVKRSPKLDAAFGRQFIVRDGARPLGLGFCGRRIVANFSALARKQLAAAVRISKAKLWDLEQARDGASRGWFVGTPQRFELLLNAPDAASDGSGKGSIAEALAELEFEADRKDIISRPLGSPKLIVEHLLKAEA